MRDFLHSEIGDVHGISNLPDGPDLAITAGKLLCWHLLEPLQATFGRIAVRSAYRSPAVNALGNARYKSCGSNERNAARHIWDRRDRYGFIGAMASIVVPWFADRYAAGNPWQAMAWWIHDHLPYSEGSVLPEARRLQYRLASAAKAAHLQLYRAPGPVDQTGHGQPRRQPRRALPRLPTVGDSAAQFLSRCLSRERAGKPLDLICVEG